MSEFEEKLNSILGNPDAMSQIMALAQNLGEPDREPLSSSPVSTPPLPDMAGLLGNLDPQTIQAGMQLLSEFSGKDDQRTALLEALKPFLKESRQAKIDRAIQLSQLSRVLRISFRLLRGKEDEHRV